MSRSQSEKNDILKAAVESVLTRTSYDRYEILIIDNQSNEQDAVVYLKKLAQDPKIKVLNYDYPFNFSHLNNFAAKHAEGEYLLFLNNDIEVINEDWLSEMLALGLRPDIGIVGAKLYYSNDTIQHQGVVLGVGALFNPVAGHVGLGADRWSSGYCGRSLLTQSMSAVTAACMLVSSKDFWRVGGFDGDHLAVAFNDIDLCLKMGEIGLNIVWCPHAELYHFESISRGREDTHVKQQRFAKEAEYMLNKWGRLLENDPYYNPNLDSVKGSYGLAFPPSFPQFQK